MYKSWKEFFIEEKKKDYSQHLSRVLNDEYAQHTIYPPRDMMFAAFDLTPLDQVKVVIIGQDPYHEPGQAMGLSFSVPKGIEIPPSLMNIYKEIHDDIGCQLHRNGDLTYLAKQGVLLLNALLTVRRGQPLAHKDIGYNQFLEDVLMTLNAQPQPIVFILWGNFARSLKKYLDNPQHLILEGCHPSPLSANRGGFFGGKYFSKANAFLANQNITPINWQN